jgi:hypothetical protein
MLINAGEYDGVGSVGPNKLVQVRFEKRAIALLDDLKIIWMRNETQEWILQPCVPLMAILMVLCCLSRKASERSGSNS